MQDAGPSAGQSSPPAGGDNKKEVHHGILYLKGLSLSGFVSQIQLRLYLCMILMNGMTTAIHWFTDGLVRSFNFCMILRALGRFLRLR